jgi:hypothetical protein
MVLFFYMDYVGFIGKFLWFFLEALLVPPLGTGQSFAPMVVNPFM